KQAQHPQPRRIGEEAKERSRTLYRVALQSALTTRRRISRWTAGLGHTENDASVHHEHVWLGGCAVGERVTGRVIVNTRSGNKGGRRDDHWREALQITYLAQPGWVSCAVAAEQLAESLGCALAFIANRSLNLRERASEMAAYDLDQLITGRLWIFDEPEKMG